MLQILNYDYVTGGKTGYTEESGRTLVSTANVNNMKLIQSKIDSGEGLEKLKEFFFHRLLVSL